MLLTLHSLFSNFHCFCFSVISRLHCKLFLYFLSFFCKLSKKMLKMLAYITHAVEELVAPLGSWAVG